MKRSLTQRAGACLLALCLTLSLGVWPAAADEPATPTVTLNQTTLNLEVGGATATLTATVKIGENEQVSPTITWASDKENVATVDTSGKVTAVAGGTATITATYSDASGRKHIATCTVTVTQKVTSLTLNDPENLSVGASESLTLRVDPTTATETIEWSVSPSGVVSLTDSDRTGTTLTGLKPGKATVTAKAKDSGQTGTCDVQVSGLVLEETSLELLAGKSETLICTAYGAAERVAQEWSSSNISVAEVRDGRISAHFPGTARIKVTAGSYSAECIVTVKEDVADAIVTNADAGIALSFSGLLSELNRRCPSGESLSYLTALQVATSQGILYYGYDSPDSPGSGVGNENYYVSPASGQLRLSDISFVANTDFGGTAVIYYTARTTAGTSFNGTIRVSVTTTGDVSYSTASNQPAYFKTEDFSATCYAKTGKDLVSVTFTQPSAKKGVLHYGYNAANAYNPEVSSGMKFYRTKSPRLDEVVFLPAEGFTGKVEIPYSYTTTGGTYSGTVTVVVYESSGGKEAGTVSYRVAENGSVTLNSSDFNTVSLDLTDSSLDYVYFELPKATEGTLYLNYSGGSGSQVSASTRYYRSGTPRIGNLTFVPAGSAAGTVKIPFTGYNTKGYSFTGTLEITISDSDDIVRYSCAASGTARFDDADFNELCQSVTGARLSYVTFEQPSSSRGTLYWSSTYSSSTKVTASQKFYRSGGTYQVDDVVFVPERSFQGTAKVPFTAYNVNGRSFSGTVEITVSAAADGTVRYQGSSLPITLRAEDFKSACAQMTGRSLSYIRFTSLPSASAGKLYLNYATPARPGTAVQTGVSYYADRNPGIQAITFLPRAGWQGYVLVPYTGVDTSGKSFSGTLSIYLSNSLCTTAFYDLGAYSSVTPSVEFLRQSGIVGGYGDGTFRPDSRITRGAFVLMLFRALELNGSGSRTSFPDVPADSVYAEAVAAAKAMGIVQGDGGLFKPSSSITRQAAITMICRAMEVSGRSVPGVSVSILSGYTDGGQVSPYAQTSVSALVYMGAVRGDSAGRLRPTAALTRAEMAEILHHVLTQ